MVRKATIVPNFRKREGPGIIKVSKYKRGEAFIDFPIEASENVLLHCGHYSVIVKNIQKESEGQYKGIVLGIEPRGGKLDDVKEGDVVSFTEDQVISASKRE
jgi:hypothetical protein